MDKDLWRLERFQDFLSERRKLLAIAVNALIAAPTMNKRKVA
jgi:hypothetical protein